jgi:hypothetical protein
VLAEARVQATQNMVDAAATQSHFKTLDSAIPAVERSESGQSEVKAGFLISRLPFKKFGLHRSTDRLQYSLLAHRRQGINGNLTKTERIHNRSRKDDRRTYRIPARA